jgi:hypothetical protein
LVGRRGGTEGVQLVVAVYDCVTNENADAYIALVAEATEVVNLGA